jgi:hypothetical protein
VSGGWQFKSGACTIRVEKDAAGVHLWVGVEDDEHHVSLEPEEAELLGSILQATAARVRTNQVWSQKEGGT